MDLYNQYSNTGNNTAYNAFVICTSTGKAAVVVGGTTVHAAFKLSEDDLAPTRTEASAPASGTPSAWLSAT
ncbi:hypothetical protein HPB48_006091 [Haemaphysalis longicornis]|uniref:ATP-dependent DNA helicase n=1 Tax=Haemaphysalis longicornis TaxID=44386 RepID=A0A9J6F9V3_HAELO|nr:hypothetical protein HPB48_006091 [Haemaphysalis longicornis]